MKLDIIMLSEINMYIMYLNHSNRDTIFLKYLKVISDKSKMRRLQDKLLTPWYATAKYAITYFGTLKFSVIKILSIIKVTFKTTIYSQKTVEVLFS